MLMKYALLSLLLVFSVAIYTNTSAQTPVSYNIHITFDEIPSNETCSAAINTYQPDLSALDLPSPDFGAALISNSAEASGLGPECRFGPGAGIHIFLSQPAVGIGFNRYGTATVVLRLRGIQVGIIDTPSGLGGRYERAENGGFDEIVLAESTNAAPLSLDDLQITFAQPLTSGQPDLSSLNLLFFDQIFIILRIIFRF